MAEFDYVSFEKTLIDELDKRNNGKLTKEELEKYFDPTKQPINNINTIEKLMKKMLFHAQNGTGKYGIDFLDNVLNHEDWFMGFNPKNFINKYKTKDQWNEYTQKEEINDECNWNGYLRTVWEVADYLSKYGSIDEFKNHIKNPQKDDIIKEIKSIHGFGDAFTQDFLKEVGVDVIKPDTHVKAFFEQVFFDGEKTKISDINEKANEVAGIIKWTRYKLDKIIYLICTGDFYNINEYVNTSKNSKRKNLISVVKEKCYK